MKPLEGNNAIVTGANRGIGRAIVQELANAGCNIWACSRTYDAEFEKSIEILAGQNNIWIKPVYFDLLKNDEIADGMKHILSDKKDINILCNVAGIAHMSLFEMTKQSDIEKVFQVNTFAPMYITQAALRKMRRQSGGYIIFITSVAAEDISRGNTIYGASKAALNQFTKSLAAEVTSKGITVNAIAPGLTDTDMSAVFEGNNPELPLSRSAINRKIDPKEIADVVIGITSDNMRIVNGQVIKANGGSM